MTEKKPEPSDPLIADAAPRRRRNRGRAGNLRGKGAAIAQPDWFIARFGDAPIEPAPPEAVERMHDGAMRVLEEIGVQFLHSEAVAILKKAGCSVGEDGATVFMGRDFVMEQVRKAPAEFAITPRNPERAIPIGGDAIVFGPVGSPPNYSTLDEGRKTGTYAAYRDLLKLSQYFNCIQFISGYPVEPIDVHPSVRHLDCIRDKIVFTDKAVHAYALGAERMEDAIELVRIGAGLSHEDFDARPRMFTNINSTSPLKHDWPMLDGAMRLARRGQAVSIAPFTLAGAMAPVTIPGAITQQTAECLAAVALLQVIRPGCPVVMGAFTSNVDMKTGAPAFGTPEYMRAMQLSGQMARYYGLPLRASNACVSNAPDAQAAWESGFSLWGVTTGQANFIYHGAGWLEGGLCASYEKFVMDCEMIQQVRHYLKPMSFEEEDIAVEAIRQVGPHGHFFGADHTQERYETAFYSPFLSDWSNFENWWDRGGVTTERRANALWKQILEEFEPPALDPAIREELDAFVARRKEEGGAPTDF